jgi:hypothetical protein
MVQEAKSPVNISSIYIYIYIYVKFLTLLGAPYIYDVSRLRVNYTKIHMSVWVVTTLFLRIQGFKEKYGVF